MEQAAKKYGIRLYDRQLACAPLTSKEAQDYYGAMAAGANYAWANRQIISHWVRQAFNKYFKGDLPVSEALSRTVFSIPIHPYLTPDEIENVCNVLLEASRE
jgi:RNA-splicing ligase RtcB